MPDIYIYETELKTQYAQQSVTFLVLSYKGVLRGEGRVVGEVALMVPANHYASIQVLLPHEFSEMAY